MVRSIHAMVEISSVGVDAATLNLISYRVWPLKAATGAAFFRAILKEDNVKPLQSLSLSRDIRFEAFHGVCSPLMANTSVRDLEIELSDDAGDNEEAEDDDLGGEDHRLFWIWITYSIFSAEATHQIDHLTMCALEMSPGHVDVFARVLNARDPLAFVPGSRQGPLKEPSTTKASREPSVVDVAPGSRIFLSKGDENAITTGGQVETLRVVDDVPRRANVCVIYPGAGVCWVPRKHVRAHRAIALPIKPACSIRRLSVCMGDYTSRTAFIRFIELVGVELHTLALRGVPRYWLDNHEFQRILAACPRLRNLSLEDVTTESFAWVWPSGSQLNGLSLRGVSTVTPDAYELFFAKQVSSPTQLRELHVLSSTVRCDVMFPSMLQMLDTNSTIERLFISMVLPYDQRDDISGFRRDLEMRNGRPLNVQQTPLPLRCTLAFLSVMSSRRSFFRMGDPILGGHKHYRLDALPELSAAVVRIIVALAGRKCFDVVHVDLIGPYEDGSYGITIIDQATRGSKSACNPTNRPSRPPNRSTRKALPLPATPPGHPRPGPRVHRRRVPGDAAKLRHQGQASDNEKPASQRHLLTNSSRDPERHSVPRR